MSDKKKKSKAAKKKGLSLKDIKIKDKSSDSAIESFQLSFEHPSKLVGSRNEKDR